MPGLGITLGKWIHLQKKSQKGSVSEKLKRKEVSKKPKRKDASGAALCRGLLHAHLPIWSPSPSHCPRFQPRSRQRPRRVPTATHNLLQTAARASSTFAFRLAVVYG